MAASMANCGSFNPRPRDGGDSVVSVVSVAIHSFNPRPRDGGDGEPHRDMTANILVSIRAPVMGAMVILLGHGQGVLFQSAPP